MLLLQAISTTVVKFLMLPLIVLLKAVDYLKGLPPSLQTPASVALDLVLLVKTFNKVQTHLLSFSMNSTPNSLPGCHVLQCKGGDFGRAAPLSWTSATVAATCTDIEH